MTTTTTVRKPRQKPERKLFLSPAGALYITVGAKEYAYWTDRLSHDFHPSFRCYRLAKFVATLAADQAAPDHYDVCLDLAAEPPTGTCECMGHLAHGSKTICKHVASLLECHRRGLLS